MKFQDALEEIKERASIVDVIGEYVTLKRSGNNYMGLCPFHNEDTPSFSVSESKKIFKCFGCHKGGNVYTFLRDYLHISFREAVLMLAKKVNVEIDDDYSSSNEYKKQEEKKKVMYELYKDAANTYYKILHSDLGKKGLDYFKSRNLTDETIKKFGLGFAPNEFGYVYNIMKKKGYDDTLLFESKLFRLYNDKPCDSFYNRVMFPLVDINNHVVGFQSRSLDPKPKERKYVNSDDSLIFHKNSFLYAMNFAFFSQQDYYILCEGNMDTITINQAGFDNTVASMGTAFNENQLFLLKRKPKKVYLCQDTDSAGIKAIIESDNILKKSGIETYVIDLKPAKDADELINKFGVSEFKKRVENPIPTFLYIVSTLKQKYNIDDPYEQEKYLNEIVKSLAEIPNDLVRDNYLKKVALQEGLDSGTIRKLLNEYLKGNTINRKVIDNSNAIINTETDTLNNKPISKLDITFIRLIFSADGLRDKMKSIVKEEEVYSPTCKYLYNLYLSGKSISDIYTIIEELNDNDKANIESVLSGENNNFDTDKLNDTLNQIIKSIKVRFIEDNCGDGISNRFEANQKILEINKSSYI